MAELSAGTLRMIFFNTLFDVQYLELSFMINTTAKANDTTDILQTFR